MTQSALSPQPIPFTGQQVAVLQSLANGCTPTEAADRSGLHRGIVYDWIEEPRYRMSLENAQREHYTAIGVRFHALAGNALNALQQILDDPRCSPHARIKAANIIFQRLERGQPELPRTVSQARAIDQQCHDRQAPHIVIGPVRQIQTPNEVAEPETEPVRQIQTPIPEVALKNKAVVTDHDAICEAGASENPNYATEPSLTKQAPKAQTHSSEEYTCLYPKSQELIES